MEAATPHPRGRVSSVAQVDVLCRVGAGFEADVLGGTRAFQRLRCSLLDNRPATRPGDFPLGFLVAKMVKRLPAIWEIQVQSTHQEVPLKKEMATHSSNHA